MQLLLIQRTSATSSAKSSCACSSGFSSRSTFCDGRWILGQGTIYPDTIESGGTAKADLIKTHHNRVAGIQKLIDEGRIIEPLSSFYKDEVRAIGRQLGLAPALLDRHPFPGPGLAIRCLCSETGWCTEKLPEGWLLPVAAVGVQGDSRTYRATLAVDEFPGIAKRKRARLINRMERINRVVARSLDGRGNWEDARRSRHS